MKPRDVSDHELREREKLRMMRSASTRARYKFGMGGLARKVEPVKPVTLPKLKCLEAEIVPEVEGEGG